MKSDLETKYHERYFLDHFFFKCDLYYTEGRKIVDIYIKKLMIDVTSLNFVKINKLFTACNIRIY